MLAASPVAHYRSALASLEDSPSSADDRSVQESITQLSSKLRQLRRSIDQEAEREPEPTASRSKKTAGASSKRTPAPRVSRSLQDAFAAPHAQSPVKAAERTRSGGSATGRGSHAPVRYVCLRVRLSVGL